jgi:hypothetical protein
MVGQTIAYVAAFYVAFVIARKDLSYIGNKLFVISFFLFGIYALVLFFYEFPISIIINEILLRASLVIVVIGSLFFVLSMQVFAQSSIYLEQIITKMLFIIAVAVCIITFIFPYKVTQIQPEIQADKSIISLLATGIFAFSVFIYNSIQLYNVLQEIEDPREKIRKKIKILLIAQLIGILSPTMSVIGNILRNSFLHAMMFVFLAIPMVIVGFLISKNKPQNK